MITRAFLGQVWLPYQYDELFTILDGLHPLDPLVKEKLKQFLVVCVINHSLPGILETDYEDDKVKSYLDELSEKVRKVDGKVNIRSAMETSENHYDTSIELIKSIRSVSRIYDFWDWCVVFTKYYTMVGGDSKIIETIDNLDTIVGDTYHHVEVANSIISLKPTRYNTTIELIK